MLGEDRRNKILQRVGPLLHDIDPDVHLHEVVLDSTRQQLAFVMQKGEWPIVIGMNWLEYVSHRDEELKERLAESLKTRLETARQRQEREEEG
jgi:hypothetical protein